MALRILGFRRLRAQHANSTRELFTDTGYSFPIENEDDDENES